MEATNLSVKVLGPSFHGSEEILTPDALRFVGFLCARFEATRRCLLAKRQTRTIEFDAGLVPNFLNNNNNNNNNMVNDPHWRCATIPPNVRDRRVEITGPVDRKMVINGLNSGANVYMADLEDSTSPTWVNIVEGQINLRDAVHKTIRYQHPKTGKVYALHDDDKTAVLFVRPRGWHLVESHITVNDQVASASLVDFGLYFFHNVHELVSQGSAPYLYLPKLEGHEEAKLWNDVFVAAQQYLGVPVGTIRATVLLETITAAFEMEEILYQLREHSLGLNCGRWDYLFSYIKKFKNHRDKIAPDRSHLTMTTPLMEAYVQRLIYICHKRGTFAMGGMSAAIPVKNDPAKNALAMRNVEQDKLREVLAGHDGTWVAHPALVSVAKAVFDKHMPGPNQISTNPGNPGKHVSEQDLLRLPMIPVRDTVTSAGLQKGVAIVLAYTEAWLRGVGCIPLNNAMEDAATAEISRAQIWQWRHFGVMTQDDQQTITAKRIATLVQREVERHCGRGGSKGKWKLAGKLVSAVLDQVLSCVLPLMCVRVRWRIC